MVKSVVVDYDIVGIGSVILRLVIVILSVCLSFCLRCLIKLGEDRSVGFGHLVDNASYLFCVGSFCKVFLSLFDSFLESILVLIGEFVCTLFESLFGSVNHLVGIVLCVYEVLTLLVFLCGEHLIAMFGLSPETTAIGRAFFHRIAVFYIVFGLSMAIRGFIEGIGDMLFSGVAGILSLVVRIVCSYALRDVFGTLVIAYAEAIAWIFMLLLYVVRYARKSREISIL